MDICWKRCGYVIKDEEISWTQKKVTYNPKNMKSSLGRPYRIENNFFLNSIRDTAIKNMLSMGFKIKGKSYSFSNHAKKKLMNFEYKDILPDDLFDAVRFKKDSKTVDENINSYLNVKTETRVYVNIWTDEILDFTIKGEKELLPGDIDDCPSCKIGSKCSRIIYKDYVEKGAGFSGASDDDDGEEPPPCIPEDFNPEKESFEWRGSGPPESNMGNWVNPETGTWMHNDTNHPQLIGPHWDYKSKSMTEKIRIPLC